MSKILEKFRLRQDTTTSSETKTARKKRPLIKELRSSIQPLDMRNLILCSVYITLENNPDLNSYTFSIYTIQKHRLAKSFLEAKKLKEECIDHLAQFVEVELSYLVQAKLIEEKEEIEGVKIFRVNKKLFTELEMRILGLINQFRNKQGITSSDLVHAINKELGFVSEKNYAFS